MALLIIGFNAEMPNGRGGRSYVAPWAATARIDSKMRRCCIVDECYYLWGFGKTVSFELCS